MKIRASHILVKHQYEAEDILRALKSGKTFEELARKYSQCPSARAGGDLGVFAEGRMDEVFEEAAFALKVNETTPQAVRTRFGYHIIKRTE
ncbi:peptidylprolyl isomerase [Bdellovibrio bacteriovorus]|uniref:peptidylprolyl isomerase n=1 Tax=Bdellovibrio bacteriovorus str. Tiberius TaxID=1069642 RepID=K7YTQ3_BDEBC|nr:peptidylprolyl isomerase [Bdellovibrio bacteriovorus]AFX99964.1 peptidyl-prolyl cis-trans isomerase C [Bdellovibrio bacteriovorus str. Tiberius]